MQVAELVAVPSADIAFVMVVDGDKDASVRPRVVVLVVAHARTSAASAAPRSFFLRARHSDFSLPFLGLSLLLRFLSVRSFCTSWSTPLASSYV